MANTWVVIPAFNEETVIREVVKSVTAAGYSAVVVDDCSTDGTEEALQNSGAHVCRHAINLGQGAALQTGIHYALKHDAEFLITFDADGQHSVDSIQALLKPLMHGRCDVTLGSRFLTGGAAENLSTGRRTVLKLAVCQTKLATGLALTDTHNGLRGFTREAAKKLDITQNRMAHASQILAQIAELKLKYEEVPVRIEYTPYSLSKGQKLSNAFNILWESFMERILR